MQAVSWPTRIWSSPSAALWTTCSKSWCGPTIRTIPSKLGSVISCWTHDFLHQMTRREDSFTWKVILKTYGPRRRSTIRLQSILSGRQELLTMRCVRNIPAHEKRSSVSLYHFVFIPDIDASVWIQLLVECALYYSKKNRNEHSFSTSCMDFHVVVLAHILVCCMYPLPSILKPSIPLESVNWCYSSIKELYLAVSKSDFIEKVLLEHELNNWVQKVCNLDILQALSVPVLFFNTHLYIESNTHDSYIECVATERARWRTLDNDRLYTSFVDSVGDVMRDFCGKCFSMMLFFRAGVGSRAASRTWPSAGVGILLNV